MNFRDRTLILAAHGSPHGAVNENLIQLALAVEQQSSFAAVRMTLHYGHPSFESVLDKVPTRDAFVLPLMMSSGYFSTTILPDRIAQNPRASEKQLRFLAPIGHSRQLPELMWQRLIRIAADQGFPPAETTILIVGHGTTKNPRSCDTTWEAVQQIQERNSRQTNPCSHFADVTAAFIDDNPRLSEVGSQLATTHVIVLPMLVSDGPHYRHEIPEAFGLEAIEEPELGKQGSTPKGQTVWVDRPVMFYESFAQTLIDFVVQEMEHQKAECDIDSKKNDLTKSAVAATSQVAAAQNAAPARTGTVVLVGAGPGDHELISVKGLKHLKRADVVVHDRLISPVLLTEIRNDAEVIDVGKYPLRHKTNQDAISLLLVDHARRGKQVVRLKGGDPFVFGRGSEELDVCRSHSVPCYVVPGISSALAGPAMAQIPMTQRGVSASFAVTTGERGAAYPQPSFSIAEMLADTLVVLMARRGLRQLAEELVASGRSQATPAACVQDASLPTQRTIVGTLETIADIADATKLTQPMVLVVGDVVRACDDGSIRATCDPDWQSVLDYQTRLPLLGRRIAVTLARTRSKTLVQELFQRGAEVLVTPVGYARPCSLNASAREPLKQIAKFDALRVTSLDVINPLSKHLFEMGIARNELPPFDSSTGTLERELSRYQLRSRHEGARAIDANTNETSRSNPRRILELGLGQNPEEPTDVDCQNFEDVTRINLCEHVAVPVDAHHLDWEQRGLDAAVFDSALAVQEWLKQELPTDICAVCATDEAERLAGTAGFATMRFQPHRRRAMARELAAVLNGKPIAEGKTSSNAIVSPICN